MGKKLEPGKRELAPASAFSFLSGEHRLMVDYAKNHQKRSQRTIDIIIQDNNMAICLPIITWNSAVYCAYK